MLFFWGRVQENDGVFERVSKRERSANVEYKSRGFLSPRELLEAIEYVKSDKFSP